MVTFYRWFGVACLALAVPGGFAPIYYESKYYSRSHVLDGFQFLLYALLIFVGLVVAGIVSLRRALKASSIPPPGPDAQPWSPADEQLD